GRQWSAKPLFPGSNPGAASIFFNKSLLGIRLWKSLSQRYHRRAFEGLIQPSGAFFVSAGQLQHKSSSTVIDIF
ncbi:MAG: hypothetical protein MUC33_05785, partial [Desulfobacterales bacterium]|nr:hypothetical protein [Desulfobacterales bacterium]